MCPRNVICFRYIIVNIVQKGATKDNDGDADDDNNNSKQCVYHYVVPCCQLYYRALISPDTPSIVISLHCRLFLVPILNMFCCGRDSGFSHCPVLKLFRLVQNEFWLQCAGPLIGVARTLVSLCLVNFILTKPCECFIEFAVSLEPCHLWLCRTLLCAVARCM